jgi:hypothetical protein
VPHPHGCPSGWPASPEVTQVICRVPSAHFSQAPWYSLPVHLCRFRVRSTWRLFPGTPSLPSQSVKGEQLAASVTIHWPTNINVVPIDYGFRPRLRGRLTLRRLALRRNPWTFGGSVSHTPVVTHVCIRASDISRSPHGSPFADLRNAPLPLIAEPEASVHGFSPDTFSAQEPLFRPVSCYAFFK